MDAEDFRKKLLDHFHGGCVSVTLSLARETGVLGVFYAADCPLTVEEIAKRSNSKERYVKELLGALVSAGAVQISEDSTYFHVPEDHKSALREFSVMCSFPTHLAERMQPLVQCFKQDGPFGFEYSQFSSICTYINDCKNFDVTDIIEKEILPYVPGLQVKLEAGIDVLELGCNTGNLLIELAKRFPKSRFVGGDIVEESVKTGNDTASAENLTNIRFEKLDVMDLPDNLTEAFDWCLIQDVVHDLPDPEKALSEIYRCLKPGQIFSMFDCCLKGSMADMANNMHACFYYISSSFICLPSSFTQADSAANGALWKIETVRKTIFKSRFKIVNEISSEKDQFVVHFICEK